MLGAAVAVVAGGGLLAAYAIACPASQIMGCTVFRGSRGVRRIALTFDDGPSDWTPAVAELLAEFNAKATFFVCGRNVERNPAAVRMLLSQGHEVGNHTYSHPFLLAHSARTVEDEIQRTQQIVENVSGTLPKWFRPPYGVRAPGLRRILPSLGLTNVLWTVIGNDWKWRAADIARRVLSDTGNGSIVCLHDGDQTNPRADRRETVAALKEIIPGLAAKGFEFATVSALLRDHREAWEQPNRRKPRAKIAPVNRSAASLRRPS